MEDSQEWQVLFDRIGEMLGKNINITSDLNEVRKIKKLLEFHRDNANSTGNMLKVLDIEKVLEGMDEYYNWLQSTS